ncbi:MAG: alkaline phosphatase family protein [Pseudomonadota bacterium]
MTPEMQTLAGRRQPLIVVGLDGYESAIADVLMDTDDLPNLRALFAESARIDLDHGRNKLSGLSWEHFSTGQGPKESGCWSAVDFDPNTYVVAQRTRRALPYLGPAGSRIVAFDVPYFDMMRAPGVNGLSNWGAHDPGVPAYSRPDSLGAEIEQKFGTYIAADDIYGFVWPDADAAKTSSARLVQSVKQRADITEWLLKERFKDWDIGLTVISELHSAIEPMWHGFDASHPLHECLSGAAAREGLFDLYRAVDAFVGQLRAAFPDAAMAAFWMHGMGSNDADVASMVLLPELLYRRATGEQNFNAPNAWTDAEGGVPLLKAGEKWEDAVHANMARRGVARPSLLRRGANKVSRKIRAQLGQAESEPFSLGWMPAYHYGFAWSTMDAFALPAFYDGRIRLNVVGREAHGRIQQRDYQKALSDISFLLRECKDMRTGQSIVGDIYFTSEDDPMAVPDSTGDIEVVWAGEPLGLVHPEYGEIGPVPYRRTAGHTGGLGSFYLSANGARPGSYGVADALDVAPTLGEWLGLENSRDGLSGQSVLSKLMPETVEQD